MALVAVLLVALAGCGGGDGDGAEPVRPDAGGSELDGSELGDILEGGGGNVVIGGGTTREIESDIDLCSLLGVEEIRGQFPQHGDLAEGRRLSGLECAWEFRNPSPRWPRPERVLVSDQAPVGLATQMIELTRQAHDDGVDVDGVCDEAFFFHVETASDSTPERSGLTFRCGDEVLEVDVDIVAPVDGLQERLVTLARLVADRL